MRVVRLTALLILAYVSGWAQSTHNRATVQQSLGFEDQSGPSITGWHSHPPNSIFTDNKVVHSGHARLCSSMRVMAVCHLSGPLTCQSLTGDTLV